MNEIQKTHTLNKENEDSSSRYSEKQLNEEVAENVEEPFESETETRLTKKKS